MNVMGSRPDGWWRDREAAMRRLLRQISVFAEKEAVEVVTVLEGVKLPDFPEGQHGFLKVTYARRRGRNAGDDRIVEFIAEKAQEKLASDMLVVTADRDLRARVEAHGATTIGPKKFLARLDSTSDKH